MRRTVRLLVMLAGYATRTGISSIPGESAPGTGATVPRRQALHRGQSGFRIITAALAAFAVLFVLVHTKRSAATDAAITLRFQRHRHPLLAHTMDVVSWPGFPPQSQLIPPALAASLWLLGLRVEAVFQALAWGTSGISFFVKAVMKRPRPDRSEFRVAIARIGGSSFPSGHVLNYMGVYGFLAYLAHTLIRPKAPRRLIVSGLVTLLALVGPSRVYLGHHWFTDVLASYLLGTSYLIGATALYRRVKGWFA